MRCMRLAWQQMPRFARVVLRLIRRMDRLADASTRRCGGMMPHEQPSKGLVWREYLLQKVTSTMVSQGPTRNQIRWAISAGN